MLCCVYFHSIDYSGTYDAAQYRIFLKPDVKNPFTISSQRAFVVDDRTIFIYAGTRDIDYLDLQTV